MWSSWRVGNDSPFRSLADSLAPRIHASFVLVLLNAPLPQFLLFLIFLQGIAGATGVSNFLRAFLMVFLKFLVLRVDEIDSSQFSCVIQMELFMWPLLLFLQLGVLSHFQPEFRPKRSGLDVSCFLVDLAPDHIYPSGAFSSNRVNCVKPVQ